MRHCRRPFALGIAMLLCATFASAQTSDRGWIDVSVISFTPAQDELTFTYQYRLYGETATEVTQYPEFPRLTGFLLGGGFRIIGALGAGLQFTQAKYEYTVGLGINIPHPTLFNRFATDTGATDSMLKRTDSALDISVSDQLPTPDTWRVRVFGGPTVFTMEQEFVDYIDWKQNYTLAGANAVTITGFSSTTVDETAWGFHVGADVAFYFSRYFGVGGGVRFSQVL